MNDYYKKKYLKYKHKYIKLRYGGEEKRNFSFSYNQGEIDYINEKIDYFIHYTPLENFIKIMKKMLLKPNRPKFGVVFASIILKNFKDGCEPTTFGLDEKIGIMIDKNILFDKDMYYFINPIGEYGTCFSDSIPGPNFKEVLKHKNSKKYIKSLKIKEYLKSNMLHHMYKVYNELFTNKDYCKASIRNTIDGLEYEIGKSGQLYPLNEICFFNNIDLKKYMTAVCLNKEIYKEIKKIIPTNVKIYL
uniref:Uncharacterized protein n=1 Tax=Mimivirus LCMiAC02 TaxID=2506609 RepID=A0A4P6VQV9_9VIRU|nr:MAG: hypothetical protein LCMiAC02_05300 [Mimivirus LCMiAC02]